MTDPIPDRGILMSGLLVVFVSAISAKRALNHEHLHETPIAKVII